MSEIKEEFCLAPLPETTRGYGRVLYAAKRRDGDYISYSCGRHCVLRRLDDPRIATVFSEHKAAVGVVAISPNGNWVASGDAHGQVIVWGPSNGVVKNEVAVCNGAINDISWSEDSKMICAVGGGAGSLARVFQFDSSNAKGDIINHAKSILSCAFRPDRPFKIATAGEDLNVNFYGGPPFKFSHSSTKHERYPNRVQYNSDGSQFITVGSDNKIFVYDGESGAFEKELTSENGHKGAIYGFCWNPKGDKILTASADKTAKIWNVGTGDVETTFTVAKKPKVDDMQMSALWHGKFLITLSLSGALNYWDPESPDAPSQVIEGHKSQINCVASSPATGKIYTGSQAGRVAEWTDGTAKWLTGKGHGKAIGCLAVSGDGAIVYSGGYDDKVLCSEAKSGEFSSDPVSCGGRPVAICAANTDHTTCAIAVAQGNIIVLKDGNMVAQLEVKYKPTCLAFSPNDKEIMVGGQDKKVYFYEFSGSKLSESRDYSLHDKQVTGVGYNKDGSITTSSGADKKILCTNNANDIKNASEWSSHASTVTAHKWNPSGTRVVSVSADLGIITWNDTVKFRGDKTKVDNAHMDSINGCDWLDDNTIVTIGGDGALKIWKA
jgi:WD40 repeat protein